MDEELNDEVRRGLTGMSPRGLAATAVNAIASRATSQFRNDVKARLAEIVTATNPGTVDDLVAAIEAQAARDSAFRDLLHRAGLIGAKAYGANINHDQ